MALNIRYEARTDGLVVQELGDELLIYDQRADVAHCLAPAAASVWRSCEAGASDEEIVSALGNAHPHAGGAAEVAQGAIAELEAKDLLRTVGRGRGAITRRQAVRRAVGVGLAAAAAPLVVSAAVTTPAQAAYCVALNANCTAGSSFCCGQPTNTCYASSGTTQATCQPCLVKNTTLGSGQPCSACCNGCKANNTQCA
jgi:hypothetical protein